jgi:hypothetical protein
MSVGSGDQTAIGEQPATVDQRRVLVIIGALLLGMLLAALDQTIVSTALPTIAGDLHGLSRLSWVITAYLLASTVSTPLWGKLGDMYPALGVPFRRAGRRGCVLPDVPADKGAAAGHDAGGRRADSTAPTAVPCTRNSAQEMERGLLALFGREHRAEIYRNLAAKAGVQISPRAVADPGGSSGDGAPADATVALTPAGQQAAVRLNDARESGIDRLTAGWEPDNNPSFAAC